MSFLLLVNSLRPPSWKIAYMLAHSDNPFRLIYAQSAWPSYQRIVKDYYTLGYNRKNPLAHPPGSWYRNSNPYPVAWNGLDGTQKTLCSKRLTPGGPGGAGWIKRREANDDEENPAVESVCAVYSSSPASSTTTSSAPSATPTVSTEGSILISSSSTSSTSTSSPPSATPTVSSKGSIVVYSSEEKCKLSQFCPVTWYLYSVAEADDYPSNVCTASPIAQHEGYWSTNSINFSLKRISGTFIYNWTNDDPAFLPRCHALVRLGRRRAQRVREPNGLIGRGSTTRRQYRLTNPLCINTCIKNGLVVVGGKLLAGKTEEL